MVKREPITPTIPKLKKAFKQRFPQLIRIAELHEDLASFKEALSAYLRSHFDPEGNSKDELVREAVERILLLIHYDATEVDELSTGEKMPIHTIRYLWQFLRGSLPEGVSGDALLDLYHQFVAVEEPVRIEPDRSLVKRQMQRWPTGLDPEVIEIREENKRRIIHCLIRKIERRHAPSSRYQFAEGMSWEEKYHQVEVWWEQSRFHLSMALKSPKELNYFLDSSLSEETMALLYQARKKGMPFFVTPYYLSLLNITAEGYDDTAIRSYIFYSQELVDTYGHIKAWEKEDLVVSGEPNAAGWLLPNGHNIHRRYPEVAILIPDSMGRACGGLCASCQRMYDFQSERLNFNFDELKPKETWDKKLRNLMSYFEEDTQLKDILITGGDALMSQNATLRKILDAVYRMALRKRKANEKRPDGERYAELQRVRLGSRLPAYLPQRITGELLEVLREFKERASQVGISQFYIQTHFQSPLEITPDAKRAIEAVLQAGWTVTNQLVYNVAASRRGHTAKLRRALNSLGVVCYYTFSVKGFQENYAVFAPNSRSLQEAREEKVMGIIPEAKREELRNLIDRKRPLGKYLTQFLKENKLLFAATDRSVLNLPGVGKSMTFKTIGLNAEGCRILKFEHDGSRPHSPIIHQMGEVYIVENKSIGAYLRQLKEMGENLSEYQTIWNYCEGVTEPQFSLYEYPDYPFTATREVTHLKLE